jgi:hypothetical protein
MIESDGSQGMCEKAIVAHFKMLWWHFSGGTERMKSLRYDSRSPVEILTGTSRKRYHCADSFYDWFQSELGSSQWRARCWWIHFKDGCIQGCCAVYSGRSVPTFRRCLLPPSSGQSSSSKHLWNVDKLQPGGATTQKTAVFILDAVRTEISRILFSLYWALLWIESNRENITFAYWQNLALSN